MVVGWVLSQGLLKGRDRDKEQAVSGAQPQHISLLWLLGSGVALGALGSGSVLPSHPEDKHRAHGKGPRTLLGVLQLPASACCRRDTDWRIAPEGIGDPTLPHQCDRGRWSPLGTEVLATPWRQDLELGCCGLLRPGRLCSVRGCHSARCWDLRALSRGGWEGIERWQIPSVRDRGSALQLLCVAELSWEPQTARRCLGLFLAPWMGCSMVSSHLRHRQGGTYALSLGSYKR